MTIRLVSKDDLANVFPVLKELRTHLDFEQFTEVYEQAHARDQYEIAVLEVAGEIRAVMGYRVLYDYVHGKHLYVDDLVTTKDERSKGFGARLLRFAEQEASRLDCTGLRLCTGIDNEDGKRFYEREGWALRAIVYKKKRT